LSYKKLIIQGTFIYNTLNIIYVEVLTLEISVEELLALDFFSKATLLAGKKGLSRIISSVNVFEAPTALEFIRGGELFLTTGFSFLQDEKLQEEVVYSLSKKGAACLLITLVYFKEVPDAIKKAANNFGLPIIIIDKDCSYLDIYKIINTFLYARATKEIKSEDEVVNEIYRSVYEEEIEGLLKVIHKWTGLTSMIIVNNQIIVYPQNDLYNNFPSNNREWKQKDVTKVHNMNIMHFTYRSEDSNYECIAINLGKGIDNTEHIILFKDKREFIKDDFLIINYAASACFMEFKRRKFILDFNRTHRENFLKDFFKGNCSREEAKKNCHKGGLDFLEEGIPVIVNIKDKIPTLEKSSFLDYVEEIIIDSFGKKTIFCSLGNNNIYMFLPNEENYFNLIKEFYAKATKDLSKYHIVIGLGRITNFSVITEGFDEAFNALKIGLCLNFNPKIFDYNKLGCYRLLCQPGLDKELSRFCYDYLQPLRHVQEENDLLHTLINYIECNYNYKDTAEKMYLHVNTIRYRVSVIEKLCRINLKLSSDRLNIEIAIKILPLIKNEQNI
jgi:purine catabolism regulator